MSGWGGPGQSDRAVTHVSLASDALSCGGVWGTGHLHTAHEEGDSPSKLYRCHTDFQRPREASSRGTWLPAPSRGLSGCPNTSTRSSRGGGTHRPPAPPGAETIADSRPLYLGSRSVLLPQDGRGTGRQGAQGALPPSPPPPQPPTRWAKPRHCTQGWQGQSSGGRVLGWRPARH